ncbi:UNVERIFIED_CONTAM: hypothetical protein FKN15_018273 [Acipenser sinensis]
MNTRCPPKPPASLHSADSPCSRLRATASEDNAALGSLQASLQAPGQTTGVAGARFSDSQPCEWRETLVQARMPPDVSVCQISMNGAAETLLTNRAEQEESHAQQESKQNTERKNKCSGENKWADPELYKQTLLTKHLVSSSGHGQGWPLSSVQKLADIRS